MLAAPDAGGHRVGRYELIRRLAVGGMAEIYLARVPGVGIEGFEKLVVLKRILPQHALDPELLRMFLDEARLSATLTHPHVTEVYDVGTSHDAPFFTMEYVHGANLRQIIKMGTLTGSPTPPATDSAGQSPAPSTRSAGPPIPLEHVVGIVAAAAAGLHYAHEKLGPGGEPLGIVHRDVSPSNVLVSYDGAVKVSDFGIAKWAFQRTQTQDGALKGKFAYMSPEQCKGQPLDRRSDVFALGTLLYELSTGVPPFTAAADFEIMSRIVTAAPEPPRWPPDAAAPYPATLSAIVMRALARDPGDRYPTAQALQLDLEAFARAERVEVSTVALAAYMQTLFADELRAWREAQRAGKSLAQHLAQPSSPTRRPSSPTVRTATDIFASVAVAPARGGRRRPPAVALAVALLAVGVGGGVIAARRPHGPASAPAPAAAAATVSTAPRTGNIVEAHPAVPTRAMETRAVTGASSPPLPSPAAVRRAARARGPAAATAVGPRPPDAPNLESRLKAWDPDSPIPP